MNKSYYEGQWRWSTLFHTWTPEWTLPSWASTSENDCPNELSAAEFHSVCWILHGLSLSHYQTHSQSHSFPHGAHKLIQQGRNIKKSERILSPCLHEQWLVTQSWFIKEFGAIHGRHSHCACRPFSNRERDSNERYRERPLWKQRAVQRWPNPQMWWKLLWSDCVSACDVYWSPSVSLSVKFYYISYHQCIQNTTKTISKIMYLYKKITCKLY